VTGFGMILYLKVVGMHQNSLASFTEWSMQPVILDSNLVSVKCIQCSTTVDLPDLNSFVQVHYTLSQSVCQVYTLPHLHGMQYIPKDVWPTISFAGFNKCALSMAEK
jgi:hypothetical protein